MVGKARRLARLFVGKEKRCLLSPLDHGGWLGPVKGLHRPRWIVEQVVSGGANALLISPGFYREVASVIPSDIGIVLRVSVTAGLSKKGTQETPIATLDTALRMDADAVAVSVFFGREGDIDIYRWLAELIETCQVYEMPVLAEMMPPEDKSFDPVAIAHAARIGMEIGADIIKTNYGGSVEAFSEVVQSVPLPIIIAGGPKREDMTTEGLVRDAITAGAAGVAIGRRVWQSDDPATITRQIASILWQ